MHDRLQVPSDKDELDRILQIGGRIRYPDPDTDGTLRVISRGRGLSVSGGIGDNSFGALITHEPDLSFKQIVPKPGEQYFLVTACDGLREGLETPINSKGKDKNSILMDNVGKIVYEYRNESCETIATQLALASLDSKSQDNISVIVTPITGDNKFTALFDGHHGQQVSKMLSNQLQPTLNKNIAFIPE